MYYDNYTRGFACVNDECVTGVFKERFELKSDAGRSAEELGDGTEKSLVEIMSPLSMSQQMLLLCYISGQVEHSEWQRCLEGDPVLAAHFSLMWSSRLSQPG